MERLCHLVYSFAMQFYGEILGYIAATLTTLAFIPQVYRVLKTQDTRAISLTMYGIFSLGVFCWLLYGLYLGKWAIILANALTLVLAATVLTIKIRNRD